MYYERFYVFWNRYYKEKARLPLNRLFTLAETETDKFISTETENFGLDSNMRNVTHWSETETEKKITTETDGSRTHFCNRYRTE